MHASPLLHAEYLLVTIVLCIAALGVLQMFSGVDVSSTPAPFVQALERWIIGGFIYFFAIYRYGRFIAATRNFDKTMGRLGREIKRIESQNNFPPSR